MLLDAYFAKQKALLKKDKFDQSPPATEVIDLALAEKKLKILRENEVENICAVGRGSTGAQFVKLKDDGSAIFKASRSGRERIFNFYKNEIAAYVVARALNYPAVPETTTRRIGNYIGSIQRKIENAQVYGFCTNREKSRVPADEFVELFIFDYIVFNNDRHDKNLLLNEYNHLVAIDHGLCFVNDHFRQFRRGFHFDEIGETSAKVSGKMRMALTRLVNDNDEMEMFIEHSSDYMLKERAMWCKKRIKHLYNLLEQNNWVIDINFDLPNVPNG